MPWKDAYTISDEKSLADEDLRWPEGKRCAVHIVVDLSVLPVTPPETAWESSEMPARAIRRESEVRAIAECMVSPFDGARGSQRGGRRPGIGIPRTIVPTQVEGGLCTCPRITSK